MKEYRTLLVQNAKDFRAVDNDGELRLEGYAAVFNSNYEFGDGLSESIDPHAFDRTINGDIRCLINHDTTYVLGRTASGTLTLRIDSFGVWFSVVINRNDTSAMDLYARVQRGDVSGCSIGFDILSEETDLEGQDIHWTITDLILYEVSIVTFPAYEETSVNARSAEAETIRLKSLEAFKIRMKEKMQNAENLTSQV